MHRLAVVALTVALGASLSHAITIETDPPGARVWTSPYHDPAVVFEGTTPLALGAPAETVRLLVRLDGHFPVFAELTPGQDSLRLTLEPIPEDLSERLTIGERQEHPGVWLGLHAHAQSARRVYHNRLEKLASDRFWWSPDGRFIAWQRATYTGEGEAPAPGYAPIYFFDRLFIIDAQTAEPRQLAWANEGGEGWSFNPSWSHDGEYLMYELPWSRELHRSHLLAYRPADRTTRVMAADPDAEIWFSAFGPDGAIYYTKWFDDGRTQLCARGRDGERVLSSGHQYDGLTVSIDGELRWLDERGIMRLEGGEERVEVSNTPGDAAGSPPAPAGDFGLSLPREYDQETPGQRARLTVTGWSRDGQWLSLRGSQIDGDDPYRSEAVAVRADGSAVVRLSAGMPANRVHIRWGPGNRLAMVLAEGQAPSAPLWLMEAPDAGPRILAEEVQPTGFGWSPDGARLAVVTAGKLGHTRIALVDATTGALTPITDQGAWVSVDWHPSDPNLLGFAREHDLQGAGCGATSFGLMDTGGRILRETQEHYAHSGSAWFSADGLLRIGEDGVLVMAPSGEVGPSPLPIFAELSPDGAFVARSFYDDHIAIWQAGDIASARATDPRGPALCPWLEATREGAEPVRVIYPFGERIGGMLCPVNLRPGPP